MIALNATLRLLAKRWLMLKADLKKLYAQLEQLTLKFARNLREKFGVVL
jgi:hypothetical protein